ncbi:Glutamate N-acetyltransferase @ N-acetylglutamate synthase [hydrothermal vent metagenome]|uniref:Glutamate N-acetyltransferase @ N-acetylglutamate synthase n=1 Tax=hydrothermal vent metagenome TaxID=652676 RepID=A0A3B0QR84_9ZZZZ
MSGSLKVAGFRASGVPAGIKKKKQSKTGYDELDLGLIVSDVPAIVAGVFTENRVKAAPLLLSKERVGAKNKVRGVVVNSGNANACTGRQGEQDARATVDVVEGVLGLKSGELLVCSTGVIGVPLPVDKIIEAVPALVGGLSPSGTADFSRAIMTTDAFTKTTSGTIKVGNKTVKITGVAKGAGMICPNMATLLVFFMTDAAISRALLQKALKEAVDASFNSIVVDNDASTNDTVLAFANGASGVSLKAGSNGLAAFKKLLSALSIDLAHKIVKDGEGATRFIELDLVGAATAAEADRAARALTTSILVKTAFFGGDPNWGRIMAALGSADIRFDPDKVDITFGKIKVARGGLDTGREKAAAREMKKKEVRVTVDLKAGKASRRLWTTDLGHNYVELNSAYRS